MDPKIQQQLDEQEVKISKILKSVNKTEKYMAATFWITIAFVVLPLLAVAIALPAMIRTLTTSVGSLGI